MDVENYRPDAQMTVILPNTPGKLEQLTPPPVLDAANDPLETISLDSFKHAPTSKTPVAPTHELPAAPPAPAAPAAHAPSPVVPATPAPAGHASPASQSANHNSGTILPVLQTEVLAPGAVDAARQSAKAAAPAAGTSQSKSAPQPTRQQTNAREPVVVKQAATFSIVVGTASVVLLAVAVGYYLYTTRKTQAPVAEALPPVAMSVPVAAASKPALQPPAQSQAVAPAIAPAVAQASASPAVQAAPMVEVVQSAPPAVVTVDLTQATAPHMLKEAEITALLKDLKKRRPPEDCDGASRMLVSDHNVLPKQAGRIAKRAYPDLCAPTPKTTTDIASSIQRAPAQDSAPPPVAAKARTLDEQYEERINSECSKGAFGYVCRESLRVKLCGKLVENPPAGQSVCKQ